jgi:hypothetical protein
MQGECRPAPGFAVGPSPAVRQSLRALANRGAWQELMRATLPHSGQRMRQGVARSASLHLASRAGDRGGGNLGAVVGTMRAFSSSGPSCGTGLLKMTPEPRILRRSSGWMQPFFNSAFCSLFGRKLARNKSEVLITQSLIDRLTDPWISGRKPVRIHQHVSRVAQAGCGVAVEYQAAGHSGVGVYPATAASVLNYGLPDIHSFDGSRARNRMPDCCAGKVHSNV